MVAILHLCSCYLVAVCILCLLLVVQSTGPWSLMVAKIHVFALKATKHNKQEISLQDKWRRLNEGVFGAKHNTCIVRRHVNILVSFDHQSNIIAAALGLETLLQRKNSG